MGLETVQGCIPGNGGISVPGEKHKIAQDEGKGVFFGLVLVLVVCDDGRSPFFCFFALLLRTAVEDTPKIPAVFFSSRNFLMDSK